MRLATFVTLLATAVAPAALAEVIVFLASPENRVTRGAVIPVYGGS